MMAEDARDVSSGCFISFLFTYLTKFFMVSNDYNLTFLCYAVFNRIGTRSKTTISLLPPANEGFVLQVSVILSTGGGACMAGGVRGRGLCVAGGMRGRGPCMTGGVHGRGACVADTMRYGQ